MITYSDCCPVYFFGLIPFVRIKCTVLNPMLRLTMWVVHYLAFRAISIDEVPYNGTLHHGLVPKLYQLPNTQM